MKVIGLSGGEIIELVEETVSLFSKLPDMALKNCAYFTLRDDLDGRVILSSQVNICPREKFFKYFSLSLEKGQRLFTLQSHHSSFQSRDESAIITDIGGNEQNWGQWGGAIRLTDGHLILSLSGLPEMGDEAVMLVVAIRAGWLGGSEAKTIATISKNPYFEPLLKMFGLLPPSI
ncbi:MAG: hypothetical protein WCW14_03280 [Candidatus Paceibacterota bacterium]